MPNTVSVPTPTPDLVREYIEKWKADRNFVLADACIRDLFSLYPLNTDIRHILVKISVINQLFNTNIFAPIPVAKHIVGLNVDQLFKSESLFVVDKIAEVSIGEKNRSFYSFATKYAHYHVPNIYAIYDSYVARVITHFGVLNGIRFSRNDLRKYTTYSLTIAWFRGQYGLKEFSVRELDIFLWIFGKQYFP